MYIWQGRGRREQEQVRGRGAGRAASNIYDYVYSIHILV